MLELPRVEDGGDVGGNAQEGALQGGRIGSWRSEALKRSHNCHVGCLHRAAVVRLLKLLLFCRVVISGSCRRRRRVVVVVVHDVDGGRYGPLKNRAVFLHFHFLSRLQPGVLSQLSHADPVARRDVEAGPDQVLHFVGQVKGFPEIEVRLLDLRVCLKGDVAADHVVEEDAQAPDGQAVGSVSSELDPLGRSVNSCS